jgi:hypothetical protein
MENYEDESVSNDFIVMWCNSGLECIVPLEINKLDDGANFLAKLEDRENEYLKEINRMIWMMELRARANPDRHYEVYKLTTSDGITKEQLEEMFEDSPQMIVDLIREKGVKIYSYRATEKPKII